MNFFTYWALYDLIANATLETLLDRVKDGKVQEGSFFTPFLTFRSYTQIPDRLAFAISYLKIRSS